MVAHLTSQYDYAAGGGQSTKKTKKNKHRSSSPTGQTIHEGKPPKKKKKDKHQNAPPTLPSNSLADLQQVEEFRHFLLRNDSQFVEYVNSPLVLSVFDSHLMRESMITMMAQVLGSGHTKDNFFL